MNFSAFRSLCLALPNAQESPHFEKVSFRIRKKIFATYDSSNNTAVVKLSTENQSLYTSMSMGTVYPVDNKWGNQGWTTLDLNTADERLIHDIIKHAYYPVAPEKFAKLLAPMLFAQDSYVTSECVLIPSLPLRVWKVLTETEYIMQWDEIPEDNDLGRQLSLGSTLLWVLPDGQYSKLTVTEFINQERIKLNLYVSHWPMDEELYDISYTYTLQPQEAGTLVTLAIGDFAPLQEAPTYHQASEHFAKNVLNKISHLANLQLTLQHD